MRRPPLVVGPRGAIHRPLHHAEEGRTLTTRPRTLPPVDFVGVDFIVEIVVNGDFRSGLAVDSVHVLVEVGAVSVVIVVAVGHE